MSNDSNIQNLYLHINTAQAPILTVGLTLQRDDARIAARAQMEVGQEIVGQIIVAHFVEAHVRLIQMHL